jgi:hypothetical protein
MNRITEAGDKKYQTLTWLLKLLVPLLVFEKYNNKQEKLFQ